MSSHKSPLIVWENAVPNDLHDAVLIVSLEGWIDAGYGAQAALGSIKQQIRTHRLVSFDCDTLIDYRARRPVMQLVNGVNTGLKWPRLQMRHGVDIAGNHVLVLSGPEPDFRWQAFTDAVMELVDLLDIRMMINLGAFPAPVPHTRPVSLGSTATTQELAEKVGFIDAAFEIPAGASAALERAFAAANKPAVGIWARVPHYVSQMLYPAAAATIMEGVSKVSGLVLNTNDLANSAIQVNNQIEQLVANNTEHQDMVRQLEMQMDANALGGAMGRLVPPVDESQLVTGEELAAELEQFLREQ
jgi:predicted ATP-grasp superfamily ATP-dependent carboligase